MVTFKELMQISVAVFYLLAPYRESFLTLGVSRLLNVYQYAQC